MSPVLFPTCGIRKFVERDIDLLVAEELRVNPAFSYWIMSHFGVAGTLIHPAAVTNVSDVEDGSEADVAAFFETIDGTRHRLFVEDKIDAILMPEQLDRYVRRGQGEVARGLVVGFSVLFLTPANYLKISLPDGVWHTSFERIAEFFRSGDPDLRAQYRASFLEKAVPVFGSKQRDARVFQNEPYVVAWWDAVYAALEAELPGFFIHRTRYPQSVYFAPSMAGQAKYLRVDFKGHKGEVDLAFKDVDVGKLREVLSTLPPVPGNVIANGRSSAIQISGLEKFVISEGLAVIPTKVLPAYRAAHRLLAFWRDHRETFDRMLTA